MAITALDVGGIAMRVAGIFVFVTATVPFGIVYSLLLPDQGNGVSIPAIVTIILIVCSHAYFLYRAYYALRFIGIVIFSTVYVLLLYYFANLFKIEPGEGALRWGTVAYLTLLYGYGVAYNSVDAFLSGLLHTKSV